MIFTRSLASTNQQEAIPEVSASDILSLRVGLFDLPTDENNIPTPSSLGFLGIHLNAILGYIDGGIPLSKEEMGFFIHMVERVFKNNSHTNVSALSSLSVNELKAMGGYEEVLEVLKTYKADILKSNPLLFEIVLKGTELEFLTKPVLHDILMELKIFSKREGLSPSQSDMTLKCIEKLSKLEEYPQYCYFSNSMINSKESVFYSSFRIVEDTIQRTPEEEALLMLFIFSIYNRDVDRYKTIKACGGTPDKILYTFENVDGLADEMVNDTYQSLLREGLRYGIYTAHLSMSREKVFPTIGTGEDVASEAFEAMQEFVDRVEKGEVKSRYTYNKFKDILSRVQR